MTSSVASSLPLALSFLHTVASQYPGFQKSQPVPPTTTSAVPPVVPNIATPAPSTTSSVTATSNAKSQAISSTTKSGSNANTSTYGAMCENCRIRPKFHDGTKLHPYCGKTCAIAKATTASQGNKATMCAHCNVRPRYHDGTKMHAFCGRTCAKASAQRKMSSSGQITVCQAPGCQKQVFGSSQGGTGFYCSMSHKALGESLCLMCLQVPKLANSHFCGKVCSDNADAKGPTILEVPTGHVTFRSVADQFTSSWRHTGSKCPTVKTIYKIVASPASLTSYNTYKASVETKGQFAAAGRSEGNENRRWHGTRRECQLGENGQTQFCTSQTCSLCCIIRTSFDLGLWGKKTGWGRFGKGIYTSSTSSKANDYSHNVAKSSVKAILLNKVVVGKGCKMIYDSVSLTAPPAGYDSVLAEKGGSLNYDELVVYTNDAIRPSYLVMYES